MREAIRSRISPRGGLGAALAVAVVSVAMVVPATAAASPRFKDGTYKAKTDQTAVGDSFRTFKFQVKKGKVTLLTEPVVARQFCLSTDVFTVDGQPKKPLSKRGAFTFTHTFFGTKIDKISGRFTESDTVEGKAVYNFFGQDLCSEGPMKVAFTAHRK